MSDVMYVVFAVPLVCTVCVVLDVWLYDRTGVSLIETAINMMMLSMLVIAWFMFIYFMVEVML